MDAHLLQVEVLKQRIFKYRGVNMKKSELIASLKDAKKKLDDLENCMIDCEHNEKNLRAMSRFCNSRPLVPVKEIDGFGWGILGGMIGFYGAPVFFMVVLFDRIENWEPKGVLSSVINWLDKQHLDGIFTVLAFALWIAAVMICGKILVKLVRLVTAPFRRHHAKKLTSKEIKKWERQVDTIKPQMLELAKKAVADNDKMKIAQQQFLASANKCGLHSDYHNETALIYIISYLETGRCNSLKEALNKYEDDRYREEVAKEERQFRNYMKGQMDSIYDETIRGANAAVQAERNADAAGLMASIAAIAALND